MVRAKLSTHNYAKVYIATNKRCEMMNINPKYCYCILIFFCLIFIFLFLGYDFVCASDNNNDDERKGTREWMCARVFKCSRGR